MELDDAKSTSLIIECTIWPYRPKYTKWYIANAVVGDKSREYPVISAEQLNV